MRPLPQFLFRTTRTRKQRGGRYRDRGHAQPKARPGVGHEEGERSFELLRLFQLFAKSKHIDSIHIDSSNGFQIDLFLMTNLLFKIFMFIYSLFLPCKTISKGLEPKVGDRLRCRSTGLADHLQGPQAFPEGAAQDVQSDARPARLRGRRAGRLQHEETQQRLQTPTCVHRFRVPLRDHK